MNDHLHRGSILIRNSYFLCKSFCIFYFLHINQIYFQHLQKNKGYRIYRQVAYGFHCEVLLGYEVLQNIHQVILLIQLSLVKTAEQRDNHQHNIQVWYNQFEKYDVFRRKNVILAQFELSFAFARVALPIKYTVFPQQHQSI